MPDMLRGHRNRRRRAARRRETSPVGRTGVPAGVAVGTVCVSGGHRPTPIGTFAGATVRDIAVFTGSAHPALAAELCEHLEVALQPTRVSRFANDCLDPWSL